jgi:hypothetical protein
MLVSPVRKPWHAKCSAYKLLEHAVSTVKLGPFRLKNQLSLFESIEETVPVPLYLWGTCTSLPSIFRYSVPKQPIWTDVWVPDAECMLIPAGVM